MEHKAEFAVPERFSSRERQYLVGGECLAAVL